MRTSPLIMSTDMTEVRPRVFVSYRRKDTRHAAGRLDDLLSQDFDLFMDVEDIAPGTDFTQALLRAVDASQVMLALIGPDWATELDESGQPRINDPQDWVAHEIAVGLSRNIVVIPVLVDEARMPDREDLPPHLADLANRHAFRLHHESFADDADRLRRAIHRVVDRTPEDGRRGHRSAGYTGAIRRPAHLGAPRSASWASCPATASAQRRSGDHRDAATRRGHRCHRDCDLPGSGSFGRVTPGPSKATG